MKKFWDILLILVGIASLLLIAVTVFIASSMGSRLNTDIDDYNGIQIDENEKKRDTIYNYWEIILDTVADRKEFTTLNKNYILELKTFSLNDSLIVRNLGQGEQQVYLDHSHTIVTDVKLLTDSTIDRKRIDRTDFKKALIPEFYKECNLYTTNIDSIVENTIYLTSDLAVPDTDNQWRVLYLIKINNDQLGDLEIKETNYVGI